MVFISPFKWWSGLNVRLAVGRPLHVSVFFLASSIMPTQCLFDAKVFHVLLPASTYDGCSFIEILPSQKAVVVITGLIQLCQRGPLLPWLSSTNCELKSCCV